MILLTLFLNFLLVFNLNIHSSFAVPNEITGTLPLEFSYIADMTSIALEYQKGLYGPIPTIIGNMSNLKSSSVPSSGPDFGGVIPSSLFKIPSLEYITFNFNEGVWGFPPLVQSKSRGHILTGLTMESCGLSGTIPS